MARLTTLLLVTATFLAGPTITAAHAADLRNVLDGYSLTSWGQKDGLESPVIRSMTQDADGYIWLGTDAGAMRFDGVRFTPWDAMVPAALAKAPVLSICTARDGGVWFGFGEPGGVGRLLNGEFQIYGAKDGLPDGAVTVLFEGESGAIWAGNAAGLHRWSAGQWQTPGTGLPPSPPYSAFTDRGGNLLVGTPVGAFVRARGEHDFQPLERSEAQVRAAAEDAEGRLWLSDRILGFRRPHEPAVPAPSAERGRGGRMLRDRRGNLWLGTLGQGLWRLRPGDGPPVVEKATALMGFSDDGVTALIEDREGNIWAGTLDGLNRLTPHRMTPLLNLGLVNSVEATPDGGIWVGTDDALIEFPNGDIQKRRDPIRGASTSVAAMHADERGRLWVATGRSLIRIADGRSTEIALAGSAPRQIRSMTSDFVGGLWLYDLTQGLLRWDGARFTPITLPGSEGRAEVVSTYSDRNQRVWMGLADARVAVVGLDGRIAVHGPAHGLTAGPYRAIQQDRQGVIWLGGENGLTRFANERFDTLRASTHFPATSLTALIDDEDGNLWLASEGSGLIRTHRDEIDVALSIPGHAIRFGWYDKSDGFAGNPRWFGSRSAARARDGRLWFVAGRGISVIDPKEFGDVDVAPRPARIEGVVADNQELPATPGLRFPPGTTRLEIEYTALNLTAPLSTRFRYRLEGFDPDWIEAGPRRQAFYTNLPPRSYQFRVVSSRSDGRWDDTGAEWTFTIRPMFYQTPAFMVACVIGLVLLVGAGWRLHLRRIRKEFSLLITERARLGREIHDTLLQSLFGVAVQCDAMAHQLGEVAPHLQRQFMRVRREVEEDIREARQSIWGLRSPRLEGRTLIDALREIGESTTASSPVSFTCRATGSPRAAAPDVDEHLLRIGREALSNAVRHAQATSVSLELAVDDGRTVLRVQDDGVGFDPDDARAGGHYGLESMHERADAVQGTLKLESAPGRGTLVEVSVPHG